MLCQLYCTAPVEGWPTHRLNKRQNVRGTMVKCAPPCTALRFLICISEFALLISLLPYARNRSVKFTHYARYTLHCAVGGRKGKVYLKTRTDRDVIGSLICLREKSNARQTAKRTRTLTDIAGTGGAWPHLAPIRDCN